MADSDNTRVCASVTRRMLLSGAMAVATAWPFQNGAMIAGVLSGDPSFDPVVSLWHEWRAAYLRTAMLCRKQQRLETRLVETIGFPRAEVHLPDEEETVTVSWHGDIEEVFGDDPDLADIRTRAEADLAAHQARWDEADARIGYSAAKREEAEASDREQDLVDALMTMPATTLAGVAAKLDAVLREGESCEDCTDFPWPQLRSALADLVRIARTMQPGSFLPGCDRMEPYPRKRREDCCPSVMMYQRGDRLA